MTRLALAQKITDIVYDKHCRYCDAVSHFGVTQCQKDMEKTIDEIMAVIPEGNSLSFENDYLKNHKSI